MQSLKYNVLKFIIFFAPIDKFYFSIGFRINYFEILVVLFIFLSVVELLFYSTVKISLNKSVKSFLFLHWGWMVFVLMSLASFIYIDKTGNEIIYFIKGFFQLFVYVLFFSFVIFFISSIDKVKRVKLFDFFIFSITISSVYGLLQIYMIIYNGVDLDNMLIKIIPFAGREIFYSDLAVGNFFRLTGLSGDPSVHASYSITAIVILLFQIFYEHRYVKIIYLFIIGFCFIFTMSGSGFSGLSSAILILVVINFTKINYKSVLIFILFLIPFFIFYFTEQDSVLHFINSKFESGGSTTSHLQVALDAIRIGLKYPIFGVGYNNFAYIFKLYYNYENFNSHNSFITFFVEEGFLGLFYKLFIIFFVCYNLYLKKNNFSKVVMAGYIGINIAALGYETNTIFLNQLILIILFVSSQIDYKSKKQLKVLHE